MKNILLAVGLLITANAIANDSYYIDENGVVQLGSTLGWNIEEKMTNGVGTRTYDFTTIRQQGGNDNIPINNRKRVFINVEEDGFNTVEFESTEFSSNPDATFPWSVWNSENKQQSMVHELFTENMLVGRTSCEKGRSKKCISVSVEFCTNFYQGLQSRRKSSGKDAFQSISEMLSEMNYCAKFTNTISKSDIDELKTFEEASKRQFSIARDGFSIGTDSYKSDYLSEGLSKKTYSGRILSEAISACSDPRILVQINKRSPEGSQIRSTPAAADQE